MGGNHPTVRLYQGDCLDVMPCLEAGSIDMVLCDLPYGTTRNKWDAVIPFEPMWREFERVGIPSSVVALTASQPFGSSLVMSNPKRFRHEWIWIKNRGSNFANTVREPMKEHETVLIFSAGKWVYNKQMQRRSGSGLDRVSYKFTSRTETTNYNAIGAPAERQGELRVPSSWQKFNTEVGLHPTQKPVALMEYLIRTYTNEGDTVLDCCMGSGTTGVACVNTGRQFVGIERDPDYFAGAQRRIRSAEAALLAPRLEPAPDLFAEAAE
ncbi:DNA-methyltransferase [Methylorubrum rhodesianum]|uniref:DNA-methyltransferase n=1 Tax=Methylorubrum rhodesianum TaxID=29427 RepID=UPI003CFCF078